MRPSRRAIARGFAIAWVAFIVGNDAAAQAYPHKPIRFIVGHAAGGANDIVARIIATRLSENLGQQVIVDNRPGAAGIIGTTLLAESAPDGYTMMLANVPHGANPALRSKLPYDTLKDFASVSLVTLMPSVLVVHPSLPVKSVKDLIALAKARPGQLNYASAGIGSSTYLSMALFINLTGINMFHVSYKSGAPALRDVIAGQIPMTFVTLPAGLPHVRAGRLRALGVTSPTRISTLQEIPTIAESGVPGFRDYFWQGVVVRAGTPRGIVVKLNAEINRALSSPDVKERIAELGAEVIGSTPEYLTDFIKGEINRWRKVITPSMRID